MMNDTSSEQNGIVKGFRRLALVVGICLAVPGAFIGLIFANEVDSAFGSILVFAGLTAAAFGIGWGAVRVLGWIVDGFIGCLVLTLIVATPVTADVTGKARIVDGDTIEIAGERIRLHGIDAPEAKQTCTDQSGKEWRCGQEATWALTRIIETHWVRCEGNERDKYGRLIAKCFTGPHDIEAKMVQQGWALAYRKYSTDYVAEEADAKAKKLGLWQGQFVAPWEWRRGKRLGSEVQKSCCKVCRKGKACGNSCISRRYTCRKQPGCACDAN